MPRITRLLVPTDFSPTSEIALQYAVDIAPAGAAIHLLHVVDDTTLTIAFPEGFGAELPGLQAQLIDDAQKQLAATVQKMAAGWVTVTTEAIVGQPGTAITADAKTRHADLIVMGTHGRGAFARFVLGSVAERVVRTAPCPVLVVRDDSRAADLLAEEMVANRQASYLFCM